MAARDIRPVNISPGRSRKKMQPMGKIQRKRPEKSIKCADNIRKKPEKSDKMIAVSKMTCYHGRDRMIPGASFYVYAAGSYEYVNENRHRGGRHERTVTG